MRKKKQRKLTALKTPKNSEVVYRNELLALVKKLRNDVATQVIPVLRALESEYTNDAFAETLSEVFENLKRGYANVAMTAQQIASKFVSNSERINRQRFYESVEKAVGVNLSAVVSRDNINDVLVSVTRQNVSLIKSIPDEYFKRVEAIVYDGTIRRNSASSMVKELQKAGGVSERRAAFIARDQSSKLNSALTQVRAENLGVREYIWRTAGDERVRGNHANKNGKTFRWDSPPSDTGHPGQDPGCRCVAQPIINL